MSDEPDRYEQDADYRPDLLAFTDDGAVDRWADQDAEIERLKADVDYWHHIATVENRALITELCDALEDESFQAADHPLVKRAREATR